MPLPVRPSDRPPEASDLQVQAQQQDSVSHSIQSNKPTGVGFSLDRSFVTALQGHSSAPNTAQQWIPVGEKDILPAVRDGIKSLNLSDEFKDKLCKPWSNTVVVRLLGKSIGYSYLCHRLHAIWKPFGNLHIVDLDRNCFLVKFANEQDYFKALTGGPWKIEYENLPDLCFECGMVGHGAQSCPKIQRKPIQPESETVEGLAVIGAAPCRSKRRNRDRTAPGW
ncbi:hypothetical protein LINPERHAP2_LOCUS29303 [Linum perenne]